MAIKVIISEAVRLVVQKTVREQAEKIKKLEQKLQIFERRSKKWREAFKYYYIQYGPEERAYRAELRKLNVRREKINFIRNTRFSLGKIETKGLQNESR